KPLSAAPTATCRNERERRRNCRTSAVGGAAASVETDPSEYPRGGSRSVSATTRDRTSPGAPAAKNAYRQPTTSSIQPPTENPISMQGGTRRGKPPTAAARLSGGK